MPGIIPEQRREGKGAAMGKLRAYFWANLDGKIVNVEVAYCRVFRNECEVNEAWKEALLAGAFDQIVIQFRNCPSASTIGDASFGDSTGTAETRIFKEGFLTLISGEGGKKRTVKYRLENVSFSDYWSTRPPSGGTDERCKRGHHLEGTRPQSGLLDPYFSVWVDFSKIEDVTGVYQPS
jgi:hypothetical protein